MTQLSYPEQLKLYLQQLEALGVEELYLEMDELNKLMPASRESLLAQMHDSIRECTLCKLCKGRRQVVFGVGNPEAELVFVGEGPGEDEDLQGIPFVGRAGQLLTKMIENGMGIPRKDVYICNVVKCRPPGNRDPEPDEINACEPFLKKQLEIIQPKVIVGLGRFAVQTLLSTKTPISRLRGKWHKYQGIPFMPTYHPSYILRQEGTSSEKAVKREVWGDLKEVLKILGK
jgi:uracil-DNA glycosylase family 4